MLRKYCPRVLPRLRSEPRRVNRFAAREVNQGPDAMNDFAKSFIVQGTYDDAFQSRFPSIAGACLRPDARRLELVEQALRRL